MNTRPVQDLSALDHPPHDAAAAAQACRTLILAYRRDPTHVDWSDVQAALQLALAAWSLPEAYFDSECEE